MLGLRAGEGPDPALWGVIRWEEDLFLCVARGPCTTALSDQYVVREVRKPSQLCLVVRLRCSVTRADLGCGAEAQVPQQPLLPHLLLGLYTTGPQAVHVHKLEYRCTSAHVLSLSFSRPNLSLFKCFGFRPKMFLLSGNRLDVGWPRLRH